MGTISSLSTLLGLSSKLKQEKCSLEVVDSNDPTDVVEKIDFKYFPETITSTVAPRLDSSATAGFGEVAQYNGYTNRTFSFTAFFTDNMRFGYDDQGAAKDERGKVNKVLDAFKKGPSGFVGDTINSVVGGGGSVFGQKVNNPKRVDLASVKAFLEGLTYPDDFNGQYIGSPNCVFNLPGSEIVSTPLEKNNLDAATGRIYCKIESLSFDHERFYENGKMMILGVQISIKEVFNLGQDSWQFLTRSNFRTLYGWSFDVDPGVYYESAKKVFSKSKETYEQSKARAMIDRIKSSKIGDIENMKNMFADNTVSAFPKSSFIG